MTTAKALASRCLEISAGGTQIRRLKIEVRCLFAILLLTPVQAPAIVPWTIQINTNNIVRVTDFGAVGDGMATNTLAISRAIGAAAAGGMTNGLSGGTVEIPAGVYLCGPFSLKSCVNLQIDRGAILRMLPFGQYPATWFTNGNSVTFRANAFISGADLTDVEISGSGAIDGQGLPWWPWARTNGAVRPAMIRLGSCHRVLIQNVTLSNSPMFHITIGGRAGNTTVQGVTIRAPSSSADPPSHNTDACDVSGTNVLVRDCNISVGDDDFTCGGGTSDVLLTNNTYGEGHGISIGSFTARGVSNITVVNCTIHGADNGIRIKSDDGRGGLVQNIHYINIGMTNVCLPIQIYGYYREVGVPRNITPAAASAETAAEVTGETPVYRNITFSNITATSVRGYPVGIIWARKEMPATNIVFDRVNVAGDRSFCLYNVRGARFIDSKITVSPAASTFTLFNAQVIISNRASVRRPVTFDGLAFDGWGNSLALYNTRAGLNKPDAIGDGQLTLAGSTLVASNGLTLSPATVLNYVLGSRAATISVAGNLTSGGTVNVTNGKGFKPRAYTLLTFSGERGGIPLVLGNRPAGFNYVYDLDTNSPGEIRLRVQSRQ